MARVTVPRAWHLLEVLQLHPQLELRDQDPDVVEALRSRATATKEHKMAPKELCEGVPVARRRCGACHEFAARGAGSRGGGRCCCWRGALGDRAGPSTPRNRMTRKRASRRRTGGGGCCLLLIFWCIRKCCRVAIRRPRTLQPRDQRGKWYDIVWSIAGETVATAFHLSKCDAC